MIAGLEFTNLWRDYDIIEVRIVAQNGHFRGTANVYEGTGKLAEAATLLRGFPSSPQDTREVTFGAFGAQFAGGGVRLEFFCKDSAGHPVVRATIERTSDTVSTVRGRSEENSEGATILLDFDAACLDRFLTQLQQLEQRHSESAILEIDPV